MGRRSKQQDPESIREQLVSLLNNFEGELTHDDLRRKVVALVPAHYLLRDLGSSLIQEDVGAARDRIILYLCKYPRQVIKGEELMVISGIGEWARRVRELRVQSGWSIVTGVTAKEMAEEGEFSLSDFGVERLKTDDYILLAENQDRDAAFRWNTANQIRKKSLSVREKILEFLKANVGKQVTGEELRYVANDKSEWARRVRELRTEFGWPISTKNTGQPDFAVGVYLLESDRQAPTHDRKIPDPVRCEVLERDAFLCRKCGWHSKERNSSDPRNLLELHHIEHHVNRGENVKSNLISLCNVCHDDIHRRGISADEFLLEKGIVLSDVLSGRC